MGYARRPLLIILAILAAEIILESLGYGVVSLCSAAYFNLTEMPLTPEQQSELGPILESAYEKFDPAIQPYLKSVPIVIDRRAQTSFISQKFLQNHETCIAFSPDFFRTAGESPYWAEYYSQDPYNMAADQPVFDDDFKLALVVHEMLHLAQIYSQRDPQNFFEDVELWYQDENFGCPETTSNITKYNLWWTLYNLYEETGIEPLNNCMNMEYCSRYANSVPGTEEFCYIGSSILLAGDRQSADARLNELTDKIIEAYAGVISPAILTIK